LATPPAAETLNRLRWRCRRGMRELDTLLEHYLAERFPVAPEAEQAAFVRLLDLPDPDLAAYLLGRSGPPEEFLSVFPHLVLRRAGELSRAGAVHDGDPVSGRKPGTGS
jgi:antitoxin CptB